MLTVFMSMSTLSVHLAQCKWLHVTQTAVLSVREYELRETRVVELR